MGIWENAGYSMAGASGTDFFTAKSERNAEKRGKSGGRSWNFKRRLQDEFQKQAGMILY